MICDGFYEWKANANNQKQPYYIYAAQEKGVRSDDPATWNNEFSETDGWKGFKVLKLAGIFGTFTTNEVDNLFSVLSKLVVKYDISAQVKANVQS